MAVLNRRGRGLGPPHVSMGNIVDTWQFMHIFSADPRERFRTSPPVATASALFALLQIGKPVDKIIAFLEHPIEILFKAIHSDLVPFLFINLKDIHRVNCVDDEGGG